MQQKKIKIVIDKKGNYSLDALEGFKGKSCVEDTRELELALGGQVVDEGKNSDYYKPDDDPLKLSLS